MAEQPDLTDALRANRDATQILIEISEELLDQLAGIGEQVSAASQASVRALEQAPEATAERLRADLDGSAAAYTSALDRSTAAVTAEVRSLLVEQVQRLQSMVEEATSGVTAATQALSGQLARRRLGVR